MESVRERRALDAFDAAIGWPEEERDNRLAALLADDPELIDAVKAMLAAERSAALMPTLPPEAPAFGVDVRAPERVGAYRPVELIGRGGMGSVYRGERIDGGFDQTVAIKLIRGGLFSAAAAEQFALERQILARLHHPHVTHLYDGGWTADGQSYIVMELLQGEPILDHIQSRGLGLKDRLSLFVDVCAAIGYAHGQGVVHADIKPSNIMVDPRHGVKLMDFGIAGLAGFDGPRPGYRAATPVFASPQQIGHEPPSTADDIYSLGVLLQVLCGDQPGFDSELAAIAAKARATEPENRYASAGDIADDIARWGRLEPISALPARPVRTLWFFWRRNRLAVSLSAAVAIGLIIAVAVMTTLYFRAETARRQSDQRFDKVRALSRYMLSDLTGALEQFPGTGALRNELARRGRGYLEGLSREPAAPPDIRLEVAEGYAKTGDILAHLGSNNVGDPTAGKIDLAKAEGGLRKLMAETHGRADVAIVLADVLTSRATIALTADNRPDLAARGYSEACGLAEGAIAHDRRSAKARLAHVSCLLGQAHLLYFQGRFADVVSRTGAALAEIRSMPPGADPTTLALDEAGALNEQGNAIYYLGDPSGALRPYRNAAAVLEQARLRAPDVRVLDQLAFTTYNIASTLEGLGSKQEELAWTERGVMIADQMRTFEDTPRAWRTVATVHLQHALALAALKRFDEAVSEAKATVAVRRVIAERSPHDYLAMRGVPVDLRALGNIYWMAGRRSLACTTFASSRAAWDQLARSNGILASDQTSEIQSLKADMGRCSSRPLARSSAPGW